MCLLSLFPIIPVPHLDLVYRYWHYSLNVLTEYMILHMTTCSPCTPSRSHRKDVKLSKRYQILKNQTPRLYGGGSQKNKLIQQGSQILTSILMSHMMVLKNPQNVLGYQNWHKKIDMWTSRCLNFWYFHIMLIHFLWTSSIVQVFDVLTLFELWHLFFLQFDIFLTFWHWLKLKPPQSVTGLFVSVVIQTSLHIVLHKLCYVNRTFRLVAFYPILVPFYHSLKE